MVVSDSLYERVGGVHGALADQADAALEEACSDTGRSRDDVLAGLLRLVAVDESGRATRCRQDWAALPDHIRAEFAPFVERRLLTTGADADADPGRPTVDLTHERLLEAWPPLRDKIKTVVDLLRLRTAVETAAADWDRRRRPRSHLWEPDRANAAVRDLRGRVVLTAVARDFLAASRRRRWFRILVAAVLVLLIAAGGVVAWIQRGHAQDGRRTAEAAKQRALIEGLLARADALRGSDPRTALRLGLAADRIAPGAPTRSTLLDILADTPFLRGSTPGVSTPGDAVGPADAGSPGSVAFAGDGATLAVGYPDKTILFNLAEPSAARRVGDAVDPEVGEVSSIALARDGNTMATGGANGRVGLWDVADRSAPRLLGKDLDGHDGRMWSMAFTRDGRTLATVSGTTAILWDVTDRAAPRRLGGVSIGDTVDVRSVTFGNGDRTLAVGGSDGSVVLWDVTDPTAPRRRGGPLQRHAGPVNTVAFTPDGRTLATAGVYSVAFTGNGRTLAASAGDGAVHLWDVSGILKLYADPIGTACRRAGHGLTPSEWERFIPDLPYQATC